MKKQSIKSLKAQIDKVKLEGFAVRELKGGDYGYNLAYGIVDDGISVAFKIPYQADDDAHAVEKITEAIEIGIAEVRFVAKELTPKGSKLVEFIDGENLTYIKLGFDVNGHSIRFTVPICSNGKKTALVFYTPEQLFALIKQTSKRYVDNFDIICATRGFEVIGYEMSNGGDEYAERGRSKFVHDAIITGKAYGVKNSFVIKNFEAENIKKRMKAELKNFKKLSLGKKNGKRVGTTDMRNFPSLVSAFTEADKLDGLFINAHFKYRNSVRDAECEKCDRYNADKDMRWRYVAGNVDCDGRFSTCDKSCEKLDRVKKDMINLARKKSAFDSYCADVFLPAVFEFFESADPELIYWRTGEIFSWRDVFPNAEKVMQDDEASHLLMLLDSGSSGKYIWNGKIITLRGESLTDKQKELLELGQDVGHNIRNAYMTIRDDDITVENGKIVCNSGKNNPFDSERQCDGTIEYVKSNIHRLTHNYKIFKTAQEKYAVDAMLAIYYALIGDKSNAEAYKAKASAVDKSKIARDEQFEKLDKLEKLEKLLKAI